MRAGSTVTHEPAPLPEDARPWAFALHVFVAFMLLSFVVKGLYFLFNDNVEFVLYRYPRASDLPTYINAAMLVALLFTALVCFFYRSAAARLPRRPDVNESIHPMAGHAMSLVAVGLLVWFFLEHSNDIAEKVRTDTILYRNMAPSSTDYESGALGVRSFFAQIRHGLFVALLCHAVIHRRHAIATVAMVYFACFAVISDGSRFTFIGSIIVLPVTLYLVRWRRDSHRRIATTLLYAAVLGLPFIVAPLQVLRAQNELSDSTDAMTDYVHAALYTFDGLDHLVNYLYLQPIDWSGLRAFEELWQFVPRALYAAKPQLYGMIALQNVLYPHSVGRVYGHFPLSNVVSALDACGPVGFLAHAAGTGAMLAWIDSLAHRRTTLSVAVVVAYTTVSYHLVRAGFECFLFGAVAAWVIPFSLFGAFLYLARTRPAATRPTRQTSSVAAPALG